MKLNILSDLHLSAGALPIPDNDADVVILAGDIARPPAAIAWASTIGKPVLYVAGNHEYYGGSIAGTNAALKHLAAGTNVCVLDADAIVIDGVRFLGATLWTDFLLYGDGELRNAAVDEALREVRDFSRIRTGEPPETLFSPDASAALFAAHAAWIARTLALPHRGPTVVITHHAPSTSSIHPRFAHSLLNPAFVSAAEHLLDGRRAQLWIHGHTHDSFDYPVNGTRVVCNPRGYARDGVNENRQFNPNFVVAVS
jgi:predicted phosphodiesterase